MDEFLELFPEHRESNEHDLMIARINHEHAEREKLEQARQELLKRKQALIAENKKRKDDLANLDQDLEKFVDVRACLLTCLPVDHHEFTLIVSATLGSQTNSKDLRKGVLRAVLCSGML